MQKFNLSDSDKHNICVDMLKLIASYINEYVHGGDTDFFLWAAEDVKYNNDLLLKFIENSDIDQLEQGIMWQDTVVREHFVDILDYIEELRRENYVPEE